MRPLHPPRLRYLATLALIAGIPACDMPLAPDVSADDPVFVSGADAAALGQAGIPISTSVLAEVVSIGPCASGPMPRLTLSGAGVAAGFGPFELEYGYCVPTFTDWKIVLRTPAGELRMVRLGGTGVIPSDHPDFEVEAHDTWRIDSGTGKFRHASGDLQADFFANPPGNPAELVITTILSGIIELGAP